MATLRLHRVLVVIGAIGLGSFVAAAADPAPPAEPLTDEQKVALRALDADLGRLDALLGRIREPQHLALTKSIIDRFKATRQALGQKFDQGKYDEVKFETQDEFQRIHLWLAPLRTAPRNPAADTSHFAVYVLEPNPADSAEVKAALQALDGEMSRLGRRNQQRAASASRDAEKTRLDELQARRVALGKTFSTAGWTALLGDLKALAEERDDTVWPPTAHPSQPPFP